MSVATSPFLTINNQTVCFHSETSSEQFFVLLVVFCPEFVAVAVRRGGLESTCTAELGVTFRLLFPNAVSQQSSKLVSRQLPQSL